MLQQSVLYLNLENQDLSNMYNRRKIIPTKARYCFTVTVEGDLPVKSDMAITPHQMLSMNLQGLPISAHMLPDDQFDDGSPEPATEINLDLRRGIDINDLWQENMNFKTRWTKYKSHKKQQAQQANPNPNNPSPKGGE